MFKRISMVLATVMVLTTLGTSFVTSAKEWQIGVNKWQILGVYDFEDVETDAADAYIADARGLSTDAGLFDIVANPKIGSGNESDMALRFADYKTTTSLMEKGGVLAHGDRVVYRFKILVTGGTFYPARLGPLVGSYTDATSSIATGKTHAVSINDGNWHQIEMRYDIAGGKLSTYIDDIWQKQQAVNANVTWTPLAIRGSAAVDGVKIYLDDIEIYSVQTEFEDAEFIPAETIARRAYFDNYAVGATTNISDIAVSNPPSGGDSLKVVSNPLPRNENSNDKVYELKLEKAQADRSVGFRFNTPTAYSPAAGEKLVHTYKVLKHPAGANYGEMYFNRFGQLAQNYGDVDTSSGTYARIVSNSSDATAPRGTILQVAEQPGALPDVAVFTEYRWYEVRTAIDFTEHTYSITVDDVLLGEDIPFSNNSTVTSTQTIWFNAYGAATFPKENDAYTYFDDIAVLRVPVPTVANTNMGGVLSPSSSIKLQFSIPVLNTAVLKNAITIEDSNGVPVENNRINVSLARGGYFANIWVAGKQLQEEYTLTVDKDAFKDIYNQGLAADYIESFIVELDDLYVINNVDFDYMGDSFAEASEVTADVTIVNPTGETGKSALVMLAVYGEGNVLLGIDTNYVADVAEVGEGPFTLAVSSLTSGVVAAKVFLWDGFSGLSPYHESICYE